MESQSENTLDRQLLLGERKGGGGGGMVGSGAHAPGVRGEDQTTLPPSISERGVDGQGIPPWDQQGGFRRGSPCDPPSVKNPQ